MGGSLARIRKAKRRAGNLIRGMRSVVIERKINVFWSGDYRLGEPVYEFPNDVYLRDGGFEVDLVTYDGKMRLTRTPIPAIKKLYESTKKWANETIQPAAQGKNILAGVASKKFDLTAVFDLTGATARQIEFKVANKTIIYDIENKKLMGKSLKPDAENRLKIRMLVDWSQLEVFAAGGVFSYSQQFAFKPDDDSLILSTNGGEVKLIALELNEVARTWPGKAK